MNITDEHKYREITFYRVTTTLSHRESEAAAFRPACCSAGVLAGILSAAGRRRYSGTAYGGFARGGERAPTRQDANPRGKLNDSKPNPETAQTPAFSGAVKQVHTHTRSKWVSAAITVLQARSKRCGG